MKFGDIVSMDYEPEMRLIVLARLPEGHPRKVRGPLRQEWTSMVLRDNTWEIGQIVTVAPDIAGLRIIEED